MQTLEIASILPSHRDFSHELHEVLDFVPIIVHEEVVDLVEVVHHTHECDQFLFVENRYFHSIPGYFFCHIRPGTRWISALQSARIFFFFSFQKNHDLPIFWVATTYRTKLINKSTRSYMTIRQRLTWQQTFFRRVISCLRPAGSSRSWVNSGEESALSMVSSPISESCKYEGLVSLEDSWMKISVVSEKW